MELCVVAICKSRIALSCADSLRAVVHLILSFRPIIDIIGGRLARGRTEDGGEQYLRLPGNVFSIVCAFEC